MYKTRPMTPMMACKHCINMGLVFVMCTLTHKVLLTFWHNNNVASLLISSQIDVGILQNPNGGIDQLFDMLTLSLLIIVTFAVGTVNALNCSITL